MIERNFLYAETFSSNMTRNEFLVVFYKSKLILLRLLHDKYRSRQSLIDASGIYKARNRNV